MRHPFVLSTEEIFEAFVWKEEQRTADWCKENIELSEEASPAMPGYVSFEETPWIEQILDDWDKPWIKEYNIMASTQTGKTMIIFCCISMELDTKSGQFQLTIPIEDGVSDYVTTKFDPFFKGIKSLQKKILKRKEEEKTRLKGALKEVPGGKLFILGNTKNNRRAKTVVRMFIDEAALFGSGHIDELIGRMKSVETFQGGKAMVVSSLKYAGDEMEVQYKNSYCKKELQVECPNCSESFYPTSLHFGYMDIKEYKEKHGVEVIENINDYKREAKDTGFIKCECGCKIDSKKIKDLKRQHKIGLKIVEGFESDTSYGYKLNALASGLTYYSTIVESLIKAGMDEDKLATLYQDYFNEIFIRKDKMVASSDVALLSNNYEEFIIPDDTIGLYMGVDSQKGYYWVTIMAIEYGIKTHLVWCGRVEDTATIEDLMDRTFYYSDGKKYNRGIRRAYHDWQGYKTPKKEYVTNDDTGEVIESLVIDMPERVKEFAFKMAQKYGADSEGNERYYAVRGERFLTNDEMSKPTEIGVVIKGYKTERKLKALRVNTTATKTSFMTTVVRNIAKNQATDVEDEAYSYEERLHFINKTEANKLKNREKTINTDYDRQITSETYANHLDERGKPSKYKFWDGTRDNHYLDCNSYIHIAIRQDNLASMRKPAPKKDKGSSVLKSLDLI